MTQQPTRGHPSTPLPSPPLLKVAREVRGGRKDGKHDSYSTHKEVFVPLVRGLNSVTDDGDRASCGRDIVTVWR